MLSVLQHQYIVTCSRCPRKAQRGQYLVCTIDGRTINEHAEAGQCADAPSRYADPARVVMPGGAATAAKPKGPSTDAELLIQVLQETPEAAWGDRLEKVLHEWGADRLAQAWEKATGLPCGCQGRKEWLNRAEKAIKGVAARLKHGWPARILQGVIDRLSKAG